MEPFWVDVSQCPTCGQPLVMRDVCACRRPGRQPLGAWACDTRERGTAVLARSPVPGTQTNLRPWAPVFRASFLGLETSVWVQIGEK